MKSRRIKDFDAGCHFPGRRPASFETAFQASYEGFGPKAILILGSDRRAVAKDEARAQNLHPQFFAARHKIHWRRHCGRSAGVLKGS